MNLDFSPEDLAFRDEVRAFIAANYPVSLRGKQDEGEELAKEDFLAWHRVLAAKGWVKPVWQTEYGGRGGCVGRGGRMLVFFLQTRGGMRCLVRSRRVGDL